MDNFVNTVAYFSLASGVALPVVWLVWRVSPRQVMSLRNRWPSILLFGALGLMFIAGNLRLYFELRGIAWVTIWGASRIGLLLSIWCSTILLIREKEVSEISY